ncbi:MAG: hypothetical protein ACOY46_15285 [Bacillota bacterium]
MNFVIKCKYSRDENIDLYRCNDDYPLQILAAVLLINGKIENWWIAKTNSVNLFQTKDYCKIDQCDDSILTGTFWEVNTPNELEEVCNEVSTEWFKQWEIAEGFKGFKPY